MKSMAPSPFSKGWFWFTVLARLFFAGLMVLTSIYCLLAYLPDTYYAFIQAPYQAWLVWLIHYHAFVYVTIWVLLGASLLREHPSGRARRVTVEFLVGLGGLGVYFLIRRPFSSVTNSSLSYLWSLALLLPVILLGAYDYAMGSQFRVEGTRKAAHFAFAPMVGVAVAIAVVYPGMELVRNFQAGQAFTLNRYDLQAWLSGILAHALFCIFVVSVYNLAESLAMGLPANPAWRSFLLNLLFWAGLQRIFQNVVLATIPFRSLASQIYAAAFTLALLMLAVSLRLHFKQARKLSPAAESAPANRRLGLAFTLVLLAFTYLVPALIGVVDWNFLLAKFWILALWLSAMAILMQFVDTRKAKPYPITALLGLVILTPFLYHWVILQPRQEPDPSPSILAMNVALASHSYRDVSLMVVHDTWSSSEEIPCDDLCQFLQTETNLPASASATPAGVDLVEHLSSSIEPKPNIFIFVVDSLRPDYLSAYNPAVTFTPEIGKFASESVVMRNSFTRYAGTTLSEPAIWAGAMLLHKHYIQPFHAVNGLEKMLDVDGYQRFISVDTVLQVVLRPTPDLVRLDEGVTNWMHEDLCSTVVDAEAKINRSRDPKRPIFLFAQPQNIHGLTIASSHPSGQLKPYPGFRPSVAAAVERLDGCFGRFVRYLKAADLYDNSIIVVTSDHGDAFGEFGHKGHAMELVPNVLRVPLILHLPLRMKKLYSDPGQIAFNADITPTLYYLLGHRPIVNDDSFGRPLFTATAQEAAQYRRKNYLVASSYGPVYGVLGNNGRTLFVSNALRGSNEYYDLAKDPGAVVNRIGDQTLRENQRLTREYVQRIADLYGFQYHPPTLSEWIIH